MANRGNLITYSITSPEVKSLCDSDARLAEAISLYGDLSYSLHTNRFSFLVETIIGQMLSNKAADAITSRLYRLCGGDISVDNIINLEQATIKGIGLSEQKTGYIKNLADLVFEHPAYFDDLNEFDDVQIMKSLTSIRGIGTWSAKMYLIFALDRSDVLPFEDGAFLQAYKRLYATNDVNPASIINRCKPWKPYSSLAARYLYRVLDSGLIRNSNVNGSTGKL